MRKVDIIRKALILAYHPHGQERWGKASDSSVRRMWRRYKNALFGPLQQVIEETYYFGCYKGAEPPIEPPKRIWQLYLEADRIFDEIDRRKCAEEDRMMAELKSRETN
jgi:hypothetical protein